MNTVDSMYKGQTKFTREQLVFATETIMSAALDRIHSALPCSTSLEDYQQRKIEVDAHINGCMEAVAIALPILWAQLNHDGMGTGDFHGWQEFVNMVREFVEQGTNPDTYQSVQVHPDCRYIAELFVDTEFEEYLAQHEFETPHEI